MSHLVTVVAPHSQARVMARCLLRYRDEFPTVFRNITVAFQTRRRPMPLSSPRRPAALLVVLLAAGCDRMTTAPGSNSIQFSRTVSLPDAHTLLQTGPTRVEVRVIPGTLVARRVELEE